MKIQKLAKFFKVCFRGRSIMTCPQLREKGGGQNFVTVEAIFSAFSLRNVVPF